MTFASALDVGEMRRIMAWENGQSARYTSTVAICTSIICAVRLAGDDINHPSPRLLCAVADSVTLFEDDPKESGGTMRRRMP